MYIAGRFRTASSPSSTLILSAPQSPLAPWPPWPLFPDGRSGVDGGCSCESLVSVCSMVHGRSAESVRCSDPHRHDHVGVVVALGADRFHHRLADFVLQLE